MACSSSGLRCTAVGSSVDGSGTRVPLGYTSTDGGLTWVVAKTLQPVGTEPFYALEGVACSGNGLRCVAVGVYGTPTFPQQILGLSYTSNDGGVIWSPSLPPPVGGSTFNTLNSVACSSNGLQCTAVGSSDAPGIPFPFAYTSTTGGRVWTSSAAITGPFPAILSSVSCSSNGLRCAAVGFSLGGILPVSYTSSDGGANWVISITLPPFLGLPPESPAGVACDSAGLQCTAVGLRGRSDGSGTVPSSYVSTDGGVNWAVSLIEPQAITTNSHGLTGVTCDSTGQRCVATGWYLNNNAISRPLSYTSTDGGATWVLSMKKPPAQGSSTSNNRLNAVG